MRWRLAVAMIMVVLPQMARSDSTIQQAQETLKEQGFYYGQITGEKNADTTAAIRRFQIRNGLSVTGELNEETLRALNSNSAAVTQTAAPAPQPDNSREEATEEGDVMEAPQPSTPLNPPAVRPPAGQIYPPPSRVASGVFADTPFDTAPPQLQRQVLLGVETSLRRRGLYRGALDGVFGPELELSLRAYQTRVGLPPSGRLDMETLASLGLLPGQRSPLMRPRRMAPPGLTEPPVRGEWIH